MARYKFYIVLYCTVLAQTKKSRADYCYKLLTYWKLSVNHAASSACWFSLLTAADSATAASSSDTPATFVCHTHRSCNNNTLAFLSKTT